MRMMMIGAALLGASVALPAAAQDRAPTRAAMLPDTDGDGATSKAEMLAAAEARFATLDTDKDGKLSEAERGAAGRMLGRADVDGDGAVSLAEMRAATGTRFDRIDANHDGKIDADERAALVARMQERRAN